MIVQQTFTEEDKQKLAYMLSMEYLRWYDVLGNKKLSRKITYVGLTVLYILDMYLFYAGRGKQALWILKGAIFLTIIALLEYFLIVKNEKCVDKCLNGYLERKTYRVVIDEEGIDNSEKWKFQHIRFVFFYLTYALIVDKEKDFLILKINEEEKQDFKEFLFQHKEITVEEKAEPFNFWQYAQNLVIDNRRFVK